MKSWASRDVTLLKVFVAYRLKDSMIIFIILLWWYLHGGGFQHFQNEPGFRLERIIQMAI